MRSTTWARRPGRRLEHARHGGATTRRRPRDAGHEPDTVIGPAMGAAKRFAGSAATGTDPKRGMEDGRHTDCGPSVRPKGSRNQSGPRRRVAIGATRKTMLALAPRERRTGREVAPANVA